MFHKVRGVELFVQDFEASLAFYRDTLGLPIGILDSGFASFQMDDQDFALMEISMSAEMMGVDVKAFEPQTRGLDRVLLCSPVANVDAAYETLRAKGVEFTKPPADLPWGLRAAYFRDPEGNIWEISHSIPSQFTE